MNLPLTLLSYELKGGSLFTVLFSVEPSYEKKEKRKRTEREREEKTWEPATLRNVEKGKRVSVGSLSLLGIHLTIAR